MIKSGKEIYIWEIDKDLIGIEFVCEDGTVIKVAVTKQSAFEDIYNRLESVLRVYE